MPPLPISLVATHELLPALRLLFNRDAPDLGTRDDTGVFVARDDAGQVCGAMLVQALPGALGVAWPPRAEEPEVADSLVRVACDWLRGRGVKVCQAFASAEQLPDAAALERNGFRHVTQLVSMRREITPESPPLPSTRSPAFRSETSPFTDEFRDTLLATHEGTLDCPELNGERTAGELLAGLTDPALGSAWYLATVEGHAVGVVSLVAGAEPDEVELSYLGVVPSARGRGVGGELLRFALRDATVAVSVDSRNEPALRLYRRHGFAEVERREVFLAHLPGEPRP